MAVPTSFYERAGLAGSNLMRGQVDASMAALLAPMELSPNELKTLEDMLTEGGKRKTNPLIRTALDLGSSPLVWIGLAMALGPWGKVMDLKQMGALMTEGKGYMREVSGLMRGLVSPWTALRNLWHLGVMNKMMGVVGKTSEFVAQYSEEWQKLGRELQRIKASPKELRYLHAYLEGWDTVQSPLLKQWASMGFDQTKPLAPGLVGKMRPELLKVGREFRRVLNEMGEKALKDTTGKLHEELAAKGVEVVEGYAPRVFLRGGEASWLFGGAREAGREYRRRLRGLQTAEGLSPHIKRRKMRGSLPAPEDLKMMEEVMDPAHRAKMAEMDRVIVEKLKGMFTVGAARFREAMAVKGGRQVVGAARPLWRLVELEDGRVMTEVLADQGVYARAGVFGTAEEAQKVGKRFWEVGLKKRNKVVRLGGAKRGELTFTGVSAEEMGPLRKAEVMEKQTRRAMIRRLTKIVGMPEVSAERVVSMFQEAVQSGRHGGAEQVVDIAVKRLGVPKYTMDPSKWFPKYVRSMGPTYGWFSTGLGKGLDEVFEEGGRFVHEVRPWQRDLWLDTLRPTLKGMLTPTEFARRAWFDDVKMRTREWLHMGGPTSRMMPKRMRDWIEKGLEGGLSEETIGGKLASMLYVSSLGLNMSPTYKNVLQNYITTLNLVGPKAMVRGVGEVGGRLEGLAGEMATGRTFKEAFPKWFPEYYEHFGYEHLLAGMTAGDVMKETGAFVGAVGGAWEKIRRGMMGPFVGSEKFNRLLAFYSTYGAGEAAGLGREARGVVARNMTMMTMFGGGALGIPQAVRNMPVLLRQFTHFPLRFVEWMYGSMAMGPDPERVSTGIMGRTMLGSTLLYSLAKNVAGVDLGPALAFSALPFPQYEEGAFYPFPMVPPAVGIAGDIMKGVASGEWGQVPGRVGTMLVPGGLAMRRAWRSWAPQYADYRARGEDGMVPVYNEKGYMVGRDTTAQLVLRGLGLRTVDEQRERANVEWLLKQRDKIRQYRREYMVAMVSNDMRRMGQVQDEFKRKYPGLGPIEVREQDIKDFESRRELTRVERVLKGLPAQYRGMFEEAIGLGVMGHMGQAADRGDLSTFEYEPALGR